MNGSTSHTSEKTVPEFVWPEVQTYIYKTVGDIKIEVDVQYLSAGAPSLNQKRPIFLNIHGGGWMGGNRSNVCRPMAYEFLQRGFIVLSMDYRLIPESDFVTEQLEDIRDIEGWLRGVLPDILKKQNVEADTDNIIVSGGSAGALLSAFTV